MILSDLASVVPGSRTHGDGRTHIRDVVYDSRAATPGSLFFAVTGTKLDGHDHAPDAVSRGAVALVVERVLDVAAPQVVVASVRHAMGPMAAEFFGHPSRAMTLAGITGTNGKTTTTFMLERCFRAAGLIPGLIGTVETHIGNDKIPVTRTTPEGIDLQRLLAGMRDAGVRGVAMEVSSHGLDLGRVDGTWFGCATFTNLTQDHLDWHGTMEAYYLAKARLFTSSYAERCAINVDDEYGRRLASETSLPVVTYGMDGNADVWPDGVTMSRTGSDVLVQTPHGAVPVRVPVAGRYNVSNALAAVATFVSLELPLEAAAAGIASLPGVPGRLEAIDEGQPFTVLVDYAHTPDSLEGVLRAAREVCEGRLTVVFGCGGDRDRGKRPLMGAVAPKLADRTIITSDNPRSERPEDIVAEIEAGARETGRPYEVEVDRRTAIRRAIEGASDGDVVVIAGKGHETGQEFADVTLPFDDRVVVREELRR